MTRDTLGIHKDHPSPSDVEVALWATATFPRLPIDAPIELKRNTIDIEDLKRVYVVYKGSRRHHFQILVERYVHQLRYGCQSKYCTTPSCFSCRKRLAGHGPVRRYNCTSARTLAVYLASQDNPEQGLCRYPSAELISQTSKSPSNIKFAEDAGKVVTGHAVSPTKSSRTEDEPKSQTTKGSSRWNCPKSTHRDNENPSMTRDLSQGNPCIKPTKSSHESSPINTLQNEEIRETDIYSMIGAFETPATTDHRSFIQNLFGTVPFKMLGWLTPYNFNLLTRTNDEESQLSSNEWTQPTADDEAGYFEKENSNSKSLPIQTASTILTDQHSIVKIDNLNANIPSTPTPYPVVSDKPCTADSEGTKSLSNSAISKSPTFNRHESPEPIERQLPKTTLNLPTLARLTDGSSDPSPVFEECPPSGIKRLSSQASIPTTIYRIPEIISPMRQSRSHHNHTVNEPKSSSPNEAQYIRLRNYKNSNKSVNDSEEVGNGTSKTSNTIQTSTLPLPNSLSILSIEVIDLLCDILQSDGTYEKHSLHPQVIIGGLRRQSISSVLKRVSILEKDSQLALSLKVQWRSFIYQSLFYVLSNPESLLKSFSDEHSQLLHSQKIWYLMLRMTRVAPSNVLDSLWIAAGKLFELPEIASEKIKDLTPDTERAISNSDAARIITLCLHALVATAPLVTDPTQLMGISRIRSLGLVMSRGMASSSELTELCLQYEDAFTDELALRLARRIFAAIPTRRHCMELEELQMRPREGTQDDDILSDFLASQKYLALGSQPALNFSDIEFNFHRKRVVALTLDWARTVMMKDWDGNPEVHSDSPFGGALATMAAIYNSKDSLMLDELHFYIEYFSERLDQIQMPMGWLTFQSNKRTMHLLDHRYLFKTSTLVNYFRGINFSRMNIAHQTAITSSKRARDFAMNDRFMSFEEESRFGLFHRLQTATTSFLVLKIRRQNVLVDAFNSIWRREERELLRPLKIRLGEESGEEGVDSGGVQQEFFRMAIAEALNPDYDEKTRMIWFQPGSPEPLWKFELLGTLISLAVYNGLTLPVTFPKALYRKLLGENITSLSHISDGWPELTTGLISLLQWDEKDGLVEDVLMRTYEFSVDQFGREVSREMGTSTYWPQFEDAQKYCNPTDAPLVTAENREEFVKDYIRWLTDISIHPQFEAFKSGFFACIDRRSINLFDVDTLQSVVEGIHNIDISELEEATKYVGWDNSHRCVKDFWSIVRPFNLVMKKRLLEFVTASDRVPVGGMKNIQFQLQRNGSDDKFLPASYTCFGVLLMPEYSSKEVMEKKLMVALENTQGFGSA
ncbi:hypothetical protein B7494_g8266 [Chlorociboria aeruginascens]|nr:hypothetical protein B7494_g8266 [Chlorociboria aeruginascens]